MKFTDVSLRDYFAAHAPIDVSHANEHFYRKYHRNADTDEMLATLAFLRFKYADAMMETKMLNCDKYQTD